MQFLAPLGLLMGFFLSGILVHLQSWTSLLIIFITLSGALRLRVTEIGGALRDPLPVLAFFVSTRVLMPLFVFFVSSFFFSEDPDTVTGFVMLFASPPPVSGFIWIILFRGNKALGLSLILLDTLLSPLVMPGTLSVLVGAKVAIDTGYMIVLLILVTVLPTVTGIAINETSRGKIPARISPYFNPLSKICLVMLVAINTSAVLPMIQFNDPKVWKIAAFCVLFSILGFVLARVVSFVIRSDFEKSVALLFPSGQRNIALTITIAVNFFPEAVALPALLCVLFQQAISGFIGKLLLRNNRGING